MEDSPSERKKAIDSDLQHRTAVGRHYLGTDGLEPCLIVEVLRKSIRHTVEDEMRLIVRQVVVRESRLEGPEGSVAQQPREARRRMS